jgi:hypothetical protein
MASKIVGHIVNGHAAGAANHFRSELKTGDEISGLDKACALKRHEDVMQIDHTAEKI